LPKLTIYSQDDAQVLLIDADLKVVDRGVGQLTVDVLPGIYKVKVERGGGAAERLLELSGDETVYQLVDRFPAVAPIEDFLGGKAFEINNLAAKAMGLDWSRAHAPPGWEGWLAAPDAPGLLILAHRLKSDAGGGGPLAGLSVKPWGGEASVALAVRAFASETDNETWSATWLPLKPGCYVLEIEDGSQKVRQAAYVAPQGWQTRVFMRRRSWLAGAPSAEKSAPRCDWFDVSIQMARRNDPVVYQDHLVTVEVARNALELSRSFIASNALIRNLLGGKFDNPMAGITGLHLFLSEIERRQSATSSGSQVTGEDGKTVAEERATINWAVENLEKLLVDADARDVRLSSDLIAVKLRAGALFATPIVVRDPPMLWASWDALRRLSDSTPFVNLSRDLWRQLAWGAAWGPYLAWPPQADNVEEYMRKQLPPAPQSAGAADQIQAAIPSGLEMLSTRSRSAIPTGLEMLSTRPRSPKSAQALEGEDLARALFIPNSLSD
jgi:hypothetical protein